MAMRFMNHFRHWLTYKTTVNLMFIVCTRIVMLTIFCHTSGNVWESISHATFAICDKSDYLCLARKFELKGNWRGGKIRPEISLAKNHLSQNEILLHRSNYKKKLSGFSVKPLIFQKRHLRIQTKGYCFIRSLLFLYHPTKFSLWNIDNLKLNPLCKKKEVSCSAGCYF